MNTRRNYIRLLALTVSAAFIAVNAAAAQPASRPAFKIRGCTTFLQLAEAEYNVIDGDTARLTKLKAERASVLEPKTTGTVPSTQSSQPATKPAATPELAKLYDVQIGNLETGLQSKRKVLAAVEKAYRDCIKVPPQATPAPKPKKK